MNESKIDRNNMKKGVVTSVSLSPPISSIDNTHSFPSTRQEPNTNNEVYINLPRLSSLLKSSPPSPSLVPSFLKKLSHLTVEEQRRILIKKMKAPRTFEESKQFIKTLNLRSSVDWYRYIKTDLLPHDIPRYPHIIYCHQWQGWEDFLGMHGSQKSTENDNAVAEINNSNNDNGKIKVKKAKTSKTTEKILNIDNPKEKAFKIAQVNPNEYSPKIRISVKGEKGEKLVVSVIDDDNNFNDSGAVIPTSVTPTPAVTRATTSVNRAVTPTLPALTPATSSGSPAVVTPTLPAVTLAITSVNHAVTPTPPSVTPDTTSVNHAVTPTPPSVTPATTSVNHAVTPTPTTTSLTNVTNNTSNISSSNADTNNSNVKESYVSTPPITLHSVLLKHQGNICSAATFPVNTRVDEKSVQLNAFQSPPEFSPTIDEFKNPLQYIESMQYEAGQWGMLIINVPAGCQPSFVLTEQGEVPLETNTTTIRNIGEIQLPTLSNSYAFTSSTNTEASVVAAKVISESPTENMDPGLDVLWSYQTLGDLRLLSSQPKSLLKSQQSPNHHEIVNKDSRINSPGNSNPFADDTTIHANNNSMDVVNDENEKEMAVISQMLQFHRQWVDMIKNWVSSNGLAMSHQCVFPSSTLYDDYESLSWWLAFLTKNLRLKSLAAIPIQFTGVNDWFKSSLIPLSDTSTSTTLHFGYNGVDSLCWSVKEGYLYEGHYLHHGAPRTWYTIAAQDAYDFELFLLKRLWPETPLTLSTLLMTRVGKPLIHPSLILHHSNIKITRYIQKPNQLIIILPQVYHCSFVSGPSILETVSFTTPDWFSSFASSYERRRRAYGQRYNVNIDQMLLKYLFDVNELMGLSIPSKADGDDDEGMYASNEIMKRQISTGVVSMPFHPSSTPSTVISDRYRLTYACNMTDKLIRHQRRWSSLLRSQDVTLKSNQWPVINKDNTTTIVPIPGIAHLSSFTIPSPKCFLCQHSCFLNLVICKCSSERVICSNHPNTDVCVNCPPCHKTAYMRFTDRELKLLISFMDGVGGHGVTSEVATQPAVHSTRISNTVVNTTNENDSIVRNTHESKNDIDSNNINNNFENNTENKMNDNPVKSKSDPNDTPMPQQVPVAAQSRSTTLPFPTGQDPFLECALGTFHSEQTTIYIPSTIAESNKRKDSQIIHHPSSIIHHPSELSPPASFPTTRPSTKVTTVASQAMRKRMPQQKSSNSEVNENKPRRKKMKVTMDDSMNQHPSESVTNTLGTKKPRTLKSKKSSLKQRSWGVGIPLEALGDRRGGETSINEEAMEGVSSNKDIPPPTTTITTTTNSNDNHRKIVVSSSNHPSTNRHERVIKISAFGGPDDSSDDVDELLCSDSDEEGLPSSSPRHPNLGGDVTTVPENVKSEQVQAGNALLDLMKALEEYNSEDEKQKNDHPSSNHPSSNHPTSPLPDKDSKGKLDNESDDVDVERDSTGNNPPSIIQHPPSSIPYHPSPIAQPISSSEVNRDVRPAMCMTNEKFHHPSSMYNPPPPSNDTTSYRSSGYQHPSSIIYHPSPQPHNASYDPYYNHPYQNHPSSTYYNYDRHPGYSQPFAEGTYPPPNYYSPSYNHPPYSSIVQHPSPMYPSNHPSSYSSYPPPPSVVSPPSSIHHPSSSPPSSDHYQPTMRHPSLEPPSSMNHPPFTRPSSIHPLPSTQSNDDLHSVYSPPYSTSYQGDYTHSASISRPLRPLSSTHPSSMHPSSTIHHPSSASYNYSPEPYYRGKAAPAGTYGMQRPPYNHPISTRPSSMHPSSAHLSSSHPSAMNRSFSHPSSTHPSPSHPSSAYPSSMNRSFSHPSSTHPSATHPSSIHPSSIHPSSMYRPFNHPSSTHPSSISPLPKPPPIQRPFFSLNNRPFS